MHLSKQDISYFIRNGDCKSIEPMSGRLAAGQYDRLHHFISDGIWDDEPLRLELARDADSASGTVPKASAAARPPARGSLDTREAGAAGERSRSSGLGL
ncbi:transposase [Rhizobium nepotum]|uniref:transposase n=1 Tax=Rhizobium nepotum TaxID=1035271 RepID=UPI00389AF581